MTNDLLGAIQGVIVAIFGVFQSFGILVMTDGQRGSVLALYGAIAIVILLLNTRFGKPAKIREAARKSGMELK